MSENPHEACYLRSPAVLTEYRAAARRGGGQTPIAYSDFR